MQTLIVGFLTLFVGFFFGLVVFPYLRAYAAKRGENLATRDDMDKLEKQVAAVTRITEEIKTEISTGLWDRQRRWDMKREVIFQAAKRLSEVDDALLASTSLILTRRCFMTMRHGTFSASLKRSSKPSKWSPARKTTNWTKRSIDL